MINAATNGLPFNIEDIWRIIREVATEDTTGIWQDQFERECIFCSGRVIQRQHKAVVFEHTPDCIVLLARHLLEQQEEGKHL
jgi:hypothetical protein